MIKSNHIAWALIIKELSEGPITAYDAVEVSGVYIATARYLLKALHKYKAVHICAWEPNSRGCDTTPVYKFGPGKDKPKQVKSMAQRQLECKARKKKFSSVNIFAGAVNE